MSGSYLTGIDYSSLFPSSGDYSGGLLDALYNTGGAAVATPGQALSALSTAEQNQTADIAAVAKQTSVESDVAAFTAGVKSATSVASLLSNQAVMKVLLTASGLGDQIGYPVLAQKALSSNPADPNSLVSQLSDTAWASTATTYAFATKGL